MECEHTNATIHILKNWLTLAGILCGVYTANSIKLSTADQEKIKIDKYQFWLDLLNENVQFYFILFYLFVVVDGGAAAAIFCFALFCSNFWFHCENVQQKHSKGLILMYSDRRKCIRLPTIKTTTATTIKIKGKRKIIFDTTK